MKSTLSNHTIFSALLFYLMSSVSPDSPTETVPPAKKATLDRHIYCVLCPGGHQRTSKSKSTKITQNIIDKMRKKHDARPCQIGDVICTSCRAQLNTAPKVDFEHMCTIIHRYISQPLTIKLTLMPSQITQ